MNFCRGVVIPADRDFHHFPALTLDPVADRGYYLYLPPLSTGTHTIHFTVAAGSSCAAPQDVTYVLTVGKAP